MKILFLDIDGVLNAHEPFDREVGSCRIYYDKVQRLNHVLRKTGAVIVLSTAWRYLILNGNMKLSGFDWLLRSHGVLGNRIIGHTAADTIHDGTWNGVAGTWPIHNERGKQITGWLARNQEQVDYYAVVDDLDLGIREEKHPFVQTDGKVGLTDTNADELIALLG